MSAAMSFPAIKSILDLPDGMHPGIPEAIYHQRIPGIASKSVLELVARAPAVYAEWLEPQSEDEDDEEPEADALVFGKAFHCALLEPDVYETTYAVEPKFGDCRKTDNKKRRDDWRAENGGRVLLKQAAARKIRGMLHAIHSHPVARNMFRGGSSELTLKWTDAATGLICKGRADYYNARLSMCVDVKTCVDARAPMFAKSAANYGYHRQHAFYEDGLEAVGAAVDDFVFVAIEKKAPYLIGLYSLEDADVAIGREWTRRNLNTLAECIEHGSFPGYSEDIEPLALPRWTT